MENTKSINEILIKPTGNEGETLDLSNLREQMEYTFDYEINNIQLDDPNSDTSLNSKMYYFDKDYNQNRIINYNNFKDSLKHKPYSANSSKILKACFIKHLVSKKKIRFQNDEFDLDMAYITDRVIAMGFPSIGCEKLYRNSIQDVVAFFERYHKGNVKIYNLCLEKNRIYDKSLFGKSKVGLFPSLDHNPCPVKLILEFCVDICLFLIQNLESVAAIHCKAGKGRTGTLISCLLLYMNIYDNAKDCLTYYGIMRVSNGKGVTVPSQIRYVYYFENILKNKTPHPVVFKELVIKKLRMYTIPHFSNIGSTCTPIFTIENDANVLKWTDIAKKETYGDSIPYVDFVLGENGFRVKGDVKIKFVNCHSLGKKETMFKLWFNTCFVPEDGVYSISKDMIDKACKDKKCKKFKDNFRLEIHCILD